MIRHTARRFAIALAMTALSIGVTAPSAFADGCRVHGSLTIRHHHNRVWAYGYGDLRPVAAPVDIPLDGTGVFFRTPFTDIATPYGTNVVVRIPHYQGPDGTYDDAADYQQDLRGEPCGRECSERSLVRWGYRPAQ